MTSSLNNEQSIYKQIMTSSLNKGQYSLNNMIIINCTLTYFDFVIKLEYK